MTRSLAAGASGLTEVSADFRFRDNGAAFVHTVDPEAFAAAKWRLNALLKQGEIRGVRLLDIGRGSGLSMLAASDLGASSMEGVHIDPRGVGRTLLARAGRPCTVRTAIVFDLGGLRSGLRSPSSAPPPSLLWRCIATHRFAGSGGRKRASTAVPPTGFGG